MTIKKLFTDGLLQIAVVLSLLRTDWHNYINSLHNYHNYPEIQDIILGPLSGITQADFHSHGWHQNSLGYAHPKNVDSYYSHSILSDLHQLGPYRRFDGINTSVDAWLVNEPGVAPLPGESAESNNNSQAETGQDDNNNNAQANVILPPQPEGSNTVTGQTLDTSSISLGSELTKEVATKTMKC